VGWKHHSQEEIFMAKKPTNHGEPWTPKDDRKLRQLAGENTPTRVIAMKLQRTPEAIRQRASLEGISLRPTNQSPYNRRRR
jgi:hypothetical protein